MQPPTRGSRGKVAKARQSTQFREKILKIKDFILKTCCRCNFGNFMSYSTCYECGSKLKDLPRNHHSRVFVDIERVEGDLSAPPLSIGVVSMTSNGEVVKKAEIFILPDGDRPSKFNPADRKPIKLHKMFLGVRQKKKVLLTVKNGKEVVLPSMSPKEAAISFVDFLQQDQGNCWI